MNKITSFQIILMAGFGFVAVVAVLIFSGVLPGYKNQGAQKGPAVSVSFWGNLPKGQINGIISAINKENKSYKIQYAGFPASSYEKNVINALASGRGPDFWLISQDMVLKNKDKISPIPFAYYPERNFRDDFIDISNLFIDQKNGGLTAFPFLIDPIVMYWNKDLFSSAGISQPPRDWDEFAENVQTFTEKNEAGNIAQSGTALGELSNIRNGKDILSMLIIQSGNPIIKTDSNGNLKIALDEKSISGKSPAADSVKFFNDFSNPNKSVYSWNKALPGADTAFARGTLAMYFGYASEAPEIKAKNPHLNFDIAEIPQVKGDKTKTTFAKIYALAIMKNSSPAKKQAALNFILIMISNKASKDFSQATGLASPRRDLLIEKTTDAYYGLLNKAAVMSKSWLEPDGDEVRRIFKDMVESVSSGSLSANDSVKLADRKLDQELKRVTQ